MLILWSLVRISTGALSKGWLTLVLGTALAAIGLLVDHAAPFSIGVTVAIIGLGLMLRWLFDRPAWDARRQNLLTAGAVLLVAAFWLGIGIAQSQTMTIALAIVVVGFESLRQVSLSRTTVVTDLESRNAFTFIGLALLCSGEPRSTRWSGSYPSWTRT